MVKLVERERFKKSLVMLAENSTHIEMYGIKETTKKNYKRIDLKGVLK